MDERASRERGRALAPAALAEAWRRWRRASSALPPGTWRRYGGAVGAAFALFVGLSVGLARAAGGSDALAAWDERALRAYLERGPLDFVAGVLLESGGNVLVLIPVTTAAALVAAWRGRALSAVGILAAYWLARLIVLAGWMTWDRARPDLVAEGIAAPGSHSFPSGHATMAAASYGYLAWLWMRSTPSRVERVVAWVLCALFVVAVVAGRVRIGSHWPSDVLVGMALGGLWAAALAWAEARASRGRGA